MKNILVIIEQCLFRRSTYRNLILFLQQERLVSNENFYCQYSDSASRHPSSSKLDTILELIF